MCISPVEPIQQPGFWGWEHTYFLKPNLSFIGLVYMCLFRFTNPTSTSPSPNLSHVPSVAEVASSLRPWKRHELSVPAARAWVAVTRVQPQEAPTAWGEVGAGRCHAVAQVPARCLDAAPPPQVRVCRTPDRPLHMLAVL